MKQPVLHAFGQNEASSTAPESYHHHPCQLVALIEHLVYPNGSKGLPRTAFLSRDRCTSHYRHPKRVRPLSQRHLRLLDDVAEAALLERAHQAGRAGQLLKGGFAAAGAE